MTARFYKKVPRRYRIFGEVLVLADVDEDRVAVKRFHLDEIAEWPDGDYKTVMEAATLAEPEYIAGRGVVRIGPNWTEEDEKYINQQFYALREIQETDMWGTYTPEQMEQWVMDNLTGVAQIIDFLAGLSHFLIHIRNRDLDRNFEDG